MKKVDVFLDHSVYIMQCLYVSLCVCASVCHHQAVDVDALHSEGLDLDVVDQMKDLSVVDDNTDGHAGSKTSDVMAAFDPSAPSTKVSCV